MFRLGRPTPYSVKTVVSGGWGRPRTGRLHRSLDITLPTGTPILAVDGGTVIDARSYDGGDSGIYAVVRHPSGLVTRYLHLSRLDVKKGQVVKKGAQIGLSGNTGKSEGPHLHLDLHVPTSMLPAVERLVGKPKGGYGAANEYGPWIAGEPWVPVDGYRPVVISEAKAFGIPLYSARRGAMAPILIGAGLGLAALLAMS